jgi:hypothetical protein
MSPMVTAARGKSSSKDFEGLVLLVGQDVTSEVHSLDEHQSMSGTAVHCNKEPRGLACSLNLVVVRRSILILTLVGRGTCVLEDDGVEARRAKCIGS